MLRYSVPPFVTTVPFAPSSPIPRTMDNLAIARVLAGIADLLEIKDGRRRTAEVTDRTPQRKTEERSAAVLFCSHASLLRSSVCDDCSVRAGNGPNTTTEKRRNGAPLFSFVLMLRYSVPPFVTTVPFAPSSPISHYGQSRHRPRPCRNRRSPRDQGRTAEDGGGNGPHATTEKRRNGAPPFSFVLMLRYSVPPFVTTVPFAPSSPISHYGQSRHRPRPCRRSPISSRSRTDGGGRRR